MTLFKLLFSLITIILPAALCAQSIKLKVKFEDDQHAYEHVGTLFQIEDTTGQILAYGGQLANFQTYYPNSRSQLQVFINSGSDSIKRVSLGKPFEDALVKVRLAHWHDTLFAFWYSPTASNLPTVKYLRNGLWINHPTYQHYNLPYDDQYAFGRQNKLWVEGKKLKLNKSVVYDGADVYINNFYPYRNGFWHVAFFNDNNIENKVSYWQIDGNNATKVKEHAIPEIASASDFAYCMITKDENLLLGTNYGNMLAFNLDTFWFIRNRVEAKQTFQPYFFARMQSSVLGGEYPAGKVFWLEDSTYHYCQNNIGIPEGTTTKAREAQSMAIYGNKMYVGLWPWGGVWSTGIDDSLFNFEQNFRLFSKPDYSTNDAPYIKEFAELENGKYINDFGQRVNQIEIWNGNMYIVTSAKNNAVYELSEELQALVENKEEYAAVHQISTPGNYGLNFTAYKHNYVMVKLKGNQLVLKTKGDKVKADLEIDIAQRINSGTARILIGSGIFGNSELTNIRTKTSKILRLKIQ